MERELSKLEQVILARLKNNVKPSAVQIGVSAEELIECLYGLREKVLIDFDIIDSGAFKGDPKNVQLTLDGKEEAEKYNDIRL